jgi:hypothetical protein
MQYVTDQLKNGSGSTLMVEFCEFNRFHFNRHMAMEEFQPDKTSKLGLTGEERERLVTFNLLIIFVSFSSFYCKKI